MNLMDTMEQPCESHIAVPFPALVRGADARGARFGISTVIDRLSARDLYLRLARAVAPGARLFILIRLSTAPVLDASGGYIAVRGVVLYVDTLPGGVCGLAVLFTHHRFLYAAAPPGNRVTGGVPM